MYIAVITLLSFQDYFVILPLAYYEGTILTKNVTSPCMMGHTDGEMCLHYAYPDIFQYNYIYGSAGYRSVDGERHAVELYDDYEVSHCIRDLSDEAVKGIWREGINGTNRSWLRVVLT